MDIKMKIKLKAQANKTGINYKIFILIFMVNCV